MSEIKFRAWDVREKRMLYRGLFDRNWYATPKNTDTGCNLVRGIHPNDKNELIIMQYIGLEDKNGVWIYQSDVALHFGVHQHVVVKERGAFGYVYCDDFISYAQNSHFKFETGRSERIEVVGDIFHPELLP